MSTVADLQKYLLQFIPEKGVKNAWEPNEGFSAVEIYDSYKKLDKAMSSDELDDWLSKSCHKVIGSYLTQSAVDAPLVLAERVYESVGGQEWLRTPRGLIKATFVKKEELPEDAGYYFSYDDKDIYTSPIEGKDPALYKAFWAVQRADEVTQAAAVSPAEIVGDREKKKVSEAVDLGTETAYFLDRFKDAWVRGDLPEEIAASAENKIEALGLMVASRIYNRYSAFEVLKKRAKELGATEEEIKEYIDGADLYERSDEKASEPFGGKKAELMKETEEYLKKKFNSDDPLLDFSDYWGIEDAGDHLVVWAELSYKGMDKLLSALDTIAQKYNKDWYWEMEDSGRAVLYGFVE